MPYVKADEFERLKAAEEVCFTLLLMMDLGMLPMESQSSRDMLATPMCHWADGAVATGLLNGGEESGKSPESLV